MTDNPNQRRSHNRKLAETLAKAGLYVFPSSGKVPLALAWERADTAIGTDAVEDIKADARAKAATKDREFDEDTFVGSTTDLPTVKRMWRKHPDAVPSISLGPSNLLVLDADIDDTRNGPQLLAQWLEDNDIDVTNCPTTTTRSGGQHIYFSGENLRSHISPTMKAMYVQVKSTGGQVVAPGAWREDGKRYLAMDGRPHLMSTYMLGSVPEVPDTIRELQNERAKSTEVDDIKIASLIAEVRAADVPDTDGLRILFDFDALAKKDEEYAALIADPQGSTSDNRFTLLKCLQREFGDKLRPIDYFALLQDAEGMGEFVGDAAQAQGEYNYRNFARDLLNSRTAWSISDGSAFGAVDDDSEYVPTHYLEAKAEREERKRDAVWKVEGLPDLLTGFEPITWLVEGLIELTSVGLAYGPPGAGKSAWAIDLSLRIAHGLAWQDRATKKMAVLYIAQEGMNGSKRRVQAWHKRAELNGIELAKDAAFFMVRRQIDLFSSDKDYRTIRKEVKTIEKLTGLRVGLIVVDTVRAALVGGDENKQTDTSIIMRYFNELAVRTAATVMGLHHTGKEIDKGASGSTNLVGSVDWTLEVTKGKVRTSKVRDAEDGQVFGFKTLGVEVGKDSAGKPTEAVVVEACEPPREKKKGKGDREVKEADFGRASDPDSEDEAESRSRPVSDRSRAIWSGLIDEIAQAVMDDRVKPDADGFKTVAELATHCPALDEMMGQNLARKLRSKVFGDEPYVRTSFGRLHFGQPSRGRGKGARLKLEKGGP